MEAQPALVRSDCAVHLDAEPTIHLNASLIVEPGHAKHDYALGLYDALQNAGRLVFWMLRQHEAQRLEHFLDCLVEFGFSGVLRFYLVHYFFNVIARSFDSGRGHNTSAHNNPPVLAARESCPETMIAVTLQPIGVGLGRYSFGLLRNSQPVRYGCAHSPDETTPVSVGSSSYSSSGSRNLAWNLGLGCLASAGSLDSRSSSEVYMLSRLAQNVWSIFSLSILTSLFQTFNAFVN